MIQVMSRLTSWLLFEKVSILVAIREWPKENDKLFDVGLNMENVTGRERVFFYEDRLTERKRGLTEK